MILGSKPLAELTEDEILRAIEELRAERMALRDEAVAAKRATMAPKSPKAPKGGEAATLASSLLDMMREEDEE